MNFSNAILFKQINNYQLFIKFVVVIAGLLLLSLLFFYDVAVSRAGVSISRCKSNAVTVFTP